MRWQRELEKLGRLLVVYKSYRWKIIVVIACPQAALSRQWETDIDRLDIHIDKSIFIDGSVHKWNIKVHSNILQLEVGRFSNLVIYITHNLACSKNLPMKSIILTNQLNVFHCWWGAWLWSWKAATRIDWKIWLSISIECNSTALVWWCRQSNNFQYFGNKSFIFSLEMALRTINPLTGYPFWQITIIIHASYR